MKTSNKPTASGGAIPGQIVMCRAANDGNGLRISLYKAVTKEREPSRVCGSCAARLQCDTLHDELVRSAR
ncbi:MAG: hypothetical protein WA082_04090 [Candidatus Moraniibacteriota bacterium]